MRADGLTWLARHERDEEEPRSPRGALEVREQAPQATTTYRAVDRKPGGRSDAHRHDDAQVALVSDGAHEQRVEVAGQLDADTVRLDLPQELEHVLRVDADGDLRPVVGGLDLFLHLA